MTTKTVRHAALASISAIGLGATFLMAAPAAQANEHSARIVDTMPAASISYTNGAPTHPLIAKIDTNGDGRADTMAYCVEARKPASMSVFRGHTTMKSYGLERGNFVDTEGVKRVALNGFPAKSAREIASEAGLRVNVSDLDLERLAAVATQAAIYKYSNGLSVRPGFRYDRRITQAGHIQSEIFNKIYAHLVSMNGPVAGGISWNVLDNHAGAPGTQTLIEIPKDKPKPTPTPTPEPEPTPDVTPTPTQTPKPTPTGSRGDGKPGNNGKPGHAEDGIGKPGDNGKPGNNAGGNNGKPGNNAGGNNGKPGNNAGGNNGKPGYDNGGNNGGTNVGGNNGGGNADNGKPGYESRDKGTTLGGGGTTKPIFDEDDQPTGIGGSDIGNWFTNAFSWIKNLFGGGWS